MALIDVPGAVPIPEKEVCKKKCIGLPSRYEVPRNTRKFKIDSSILNKILHEYGIKKRRKENLHLPSDRD